MLDNFLDLLPYFIMSMLYAYPAALALQNFRKFRDWPSLSLVPSFSWMALYFTIAPYVSPCIGLLWGRLAFLVLSTSITITMIWRYSMLRGYKWIR